MDTINEPAIANATIIIPIEIRYNSLDIWKYSFDFDAVF